MGEVVRFPGSRKSRKTRKCDAEQDPFAYVIRIQDEFIAKLKAEIAAHDACAGYTKQIIQYQKDHSDGDDVA